MELQAHSWHGTLVALWQWQPKVAEESYEKKQLQACEVSFHSQPEYLFGEVERAQSIQSA